MSDLKKKSIKIVSTEKSTLDNGSVLFKVYDQDDVVYSFFKNKTDGTESKAYTVFKKLGVEPEGKEVNIAYAEVEKEYDGKNRVFRNIRFIDISMLDSVDTDDTTQEKQVENDVVDEIQVDDVPF